MPEIKLETFEPDVFPASANSIIATVNGRRVKVEAWASDSCAGVDFTDADATDDLVGWLGQIDDEEDEEGISIIGADGVRLDSEDQLTALCEEVGEHYRRLWTEHVERAVNWCAAEAVRLTNGQQPTEWAAGSAARVGVFEDDGTIRLIPPVKRDGPDFTYLHDLLAEVDAAAQGDSNDHEFDVLNMALGEACRLLGLTDRA